jgi:hypothetical protein
MLITSSELDLNNKKEDNNLSRKTLVESPNLSKVKSTETHSQIQKISNKYLRIMQTQTSFVSEINADKYTTN